MDYTLHQIIGDLIKYGLPEDYFNPFVVITFGNKQYVTDFRQLSILNLFNYPYDKYVNRNGGMPCIALANFYNPDCGIIIPVMHNGVETTLKIKLKHARDVYELYCKKCLDYINTYNMLVEGVTDIFNDTKLSDKDRVVAIDKLYSTSKVGSSVKRVKKV
jgi:hypothetical protein